MKLSTSTIITKDSYITEPITSFERSFSMLEKAGFDGVDICFWDLSVKGSWFAEDGWENTILEISELAKKYNLHINQTHANTYTGKQWDDPDYPLHDFQTETVLRAIKATAMIGGKWVVVHPMNLPHDPLYSAKKAKETAIKNLEPYINEAKKLGVGIAVETMVDFRGNRRRYCGGDIYELIDLDDTINDEVVGICLDTGHAHIGGVEPAAAIYEIGKRLKATHINDNHASTSDEHLLPYFGTIDWQKTVKALKDIGYDGDFAYEVGPQSVPAELYEEWLRYSANLGKYLLSL